MSYIVLARKWRPKRFSEMVGQEHVLRAFGNALDSGKIHHAFLFSGTRGVGKTTVARILAKSLNCETGVSANPCGICTACREVDEGRFVDLIEVDAASRTKVDDTRELLDNVQYAPTRGRYKVYLIDEVHMLSGHSFNALLKTLEEPPPHVKFLLATTDPQKLPVTVLSRCLQFNLKRLSANLIGERLKFIAAAENLQFEPAALSLLARAAEGSLRDALSLLDQLIAFGGAALTEANTRAMLGTIDRGHVARIVEALSLGDGPGLLAQVQELDRDAPDYDRALVELAAFLQRIAIAQIVPEAVQHEEEFDAQTLTRLGQAMSAEDVQLYYQIALGGRRDLAMAPEPRLGFEMTLLRMLAFRPETAAAATAAAATCGARPRRARRHRHRCRGTGRAGSCRGTDHAGRAGHAGSCAIAAPAPPLAPLAAVPLAINENSWPERRRRRTVERYGAPVRVELRARFIRKWRAHAAARSVGGRAALARHRGEAPAGVGEIPGARHPRDLRSRRCVARHACAAARHGGAGSCTARRDGVRRGSRGQGLAGAFRCRGGCRFGETCELVF